MTGPQGQWGWPPSPQNQPQPAGDTLIFKVIGWICAAVSVLFFPILFGPIGIAMGYLTRRRGDETGGQALMIGAAVCMVVGFMLGFLLVALV